MIWDITLSCDHRMLVIAPTLSEALDIAKVEAARHRTTVENAEVVDLGRAGLLAWYPGPWSRDAVIDPPEDPDAEPVGAGDDYWGRPTASEHPEYWTE